MWFKNNYELPAQGYGVLWIKETGALSPWRKATNNDEWTSNPKHRAADRIEKGK